MSGRAMQRILVADVGGTNCRMGSFRLEGASLALERSARISSANLESGQDLFLALSQGLDLRPEEAGAVVIGLAGPVNGQKGSLTNGRLRVDLAAVPSLAGTGRCLLLNDFMLQAYAILTPPGAQASYVAGPEQKKGEDAIFPGKEPAGRVKNACVRKTHAVVGAGTGLGAASLLLTDQGVPLAVPSEAGHAAFAFLDKEEQDYGRALCKGLGRAFASAENVLCGRGLSTLHYYLTGQMLHPSQVGDSALSRDTPTLRWYARFLGRFCQEWILSSLCREGLWIAGGVAAANPLCVSCPSFSEALYAGAGDVVSLLQSVPVRLVTDTDSGLWGGAYAGLALCGIELADIENA